MNEFLDFLAMGGYAHFVWPAYAVAFVLMTANLLLPLQCERRQWREIKARQRRRSAPQGEAASAADAPVPPHTEVPS